MLSKAASSTIFWVFSMTRPRIEPWSPGLLVNTLLISPIDSTKIYLPNHSWHVFTQPFHHRQDAARGQFLSGVQEVWIQIFPSSRLVVVQRLKSPSYLTIYSNMGRWKKCIHAFLWGIRTKWNAKSRTRFELESSSPFQTTFSHQ